jgi:lipopolysaccharide transport system ATP-binding protein
MSEPAIIVRELGKQFEIGSACKRYRTLRESLSEAASAPLRWFRKGGAAHPFIWALRDVSFEVHRGEVVGIIGRNGAGKSTLLKILSRITEPTEGSARIRGRIGSLLEVGTGFHLELTGRENIFLNGAIIGMTRSEIARKFDEIVAFAEVEPFIDTPVKHYSSGMHLRLAFAVAAHLEPEILLMDEVLAVGDASFQRKCLGKMARVAQEGRTVLFVSHNIEAVNTLCDRGLWFEQGRIQADGPVEEVTGAYLETLNSGAFSFVSQRGNLKVEGVCLRNAAGHPSSCFAPGEDMVVEISLDAGEVLEQPQIWLKVISLRGPCFAANTELDGAGPRRLAGRQRIACRFRELPLLPQRYVLLLAIRAMNRDFIVPEQEVACFNVAANLREYGFKGDYLTHTGKATAVVIPYEWSMPDGSLTALALTRAAAATGNGRA